MSDEMKEMAAVNEAMGITPNCPGGQLYTVRAGDSMFFIAKRFNVSLQSLIQANPQIADPNLIYPGQIICIPTGGPGPVPNCPGGWIYRVQRGDTMFEIARRNNITLAMLIAANPQITDPDRIFPGQMICVPSSGAIATPVPTEPPIVLPPMPCPPVRPVPPLPCPTPVAPIQTQPPCQYPMPVYVVVPWEECPYRPKKKKCGRKHRHCR
jgi:spore coat assembly protein SafA